VFRALATTFMLRQISRVRHVGKVKLSLNLTNLALNQEDVWRSGYTEPCILDLGIRWSGQLHAPSALPPGKQPPPPPRNNWVGR
jgi:hypothetical protein